MSDSRGYRHPFNDCTFYLGGVGDQPRTLSDLAMSQFSAELRRKPDWWRTYRSRRDAWAQEACDRVWDVILPSTTITQVKLNDNQIQYVLDELAGYAALHDTPHKCQPSSFERIWESVSLIEPSTLADLNRELASLVPKGARSPPQDAISSIGLIDPYCYPLIYGKTVSSVDRLPIPLPREDLYSISHRFALLPTDIQITASQTVEFLSYINNLHPSHRHLYRLLQTTLNAFIPLFEHTLTDLHRINSLRQRIPGQSWYSQWDEPEAPEYSDDDEGWETYEKDMWQWLSCRPINLPDVSEQGYLGGLEDRRHVVTLAGRKVQVIIAASEIKVPVRTIDNSTHRWRVQGMKNERIVASAFYYTSMENITDASIDFRMAVTFPRGFSAGDNGATLRTWGLSDGDPCHQYIGSVQVREGLAIVFPNIYQFCHKPVRLADPSKAGLIRMVSFLLVDPDIPPIPSTATVGPQQRAWIREALHEYVDVRLPREVVNHIVDCAHWTMEDDEADQVTTQMLEERRNFIAENDQHYFCIPFDVFNGPDVLLYS